MSSLGEGGAGHLRWWTESCVQLPQMNHVCEVSYSLTLITTANQSSLRRRSFLGPGAWPAELEQNWAALWRTSASSLLTPFPTRSLRSTRAPDKGQQTGPTLVTVQGAMGAPDMWGSSACQQRGKQLADFTGLECNMTSFHQACMRRVCNMQGQSLMAGRIQSRAQLCRH